MVKTIRLFCTHNYLNVCPFGSNRAWFLGKLLILNYYTQSAPYKNVLHAH